MSSSCTRAARRHCSPTRAFSASELLMADPLPLSGGGSTLPLRWKLRRDLSRATDSSCPGLTRASTPFFSICQDVDGRDKPGHDDAEKDAAPPFTLPWRAFSRGGSFPLKFALRFSTKAFAAFSSRRRPGHVNQSHVNQSHVKPKSRRPREHHLSCRRTRWASGALRPVSLG